MTQPPTMKSQVTLLLICMLFSKVMSLTCRQCVSINGSCPDKQITCPYQCATSTTAVYIDGTTVDSNIKMCVTPEMCANGSLTLGAVKVTTNTKCCTTDLCNAETLPDLPVPPPNGGMCYTCDNNDCSGKVICNGYENRCISASVRQGNNVVFMKGCASQSLCTDSGNSSTSAIGVTDVQCCEGNLCNGAESFTPRSFLLVLLPLLSSILFY